MTKTIDLNSDGCHCCGRKGHCAFIYIYDIPHSIKDHVMKNPRSGSPSSSPLTCYACLADTNTVLIYAGAALAGLFDLDLNYVDLSSDDEWYAALTAEERAPRVL